MFKQKLLFNLSAVAKLLLEHHHLRLLTLFFVSMHCVSTPGGALSEHASILTIYNVRPQDDD
jgi:hypothetical protein